MDERSLKKSLQESWIKQILFFDELASTNDFAKKARNVFDVPTLVITANQTHGRGRGGNVWFSNHDALTFTIVIPSSCRLPWFSDEGPLSLIVGFALCNAVTSLEIEHAIDQAKIVQLKWPNDLMLSGRKAGGILVESRFEEHRGEPERRVVGRRWCIGIGINVNGESAPAPSEIQNQARTLAREFGRRFDRLEVLQSVIQSIQSAFENYQQGSDWIRQMDRRFSLLRGRRVIIQTAGEDVEGVCCGLNSAGELLLEVDSDADSQGAWQGPSGGNQVAIASGTVIDWS